MNHYPTGTDMDILDCLAQVRISFRQCDMQPPTAILLGSHEEGLRFLNQIRQTNSWTALVGSPDLGRVVEMADGSAWMECKVMDIAVRWPANRLAMPDGSWSYV